MSDPHLLIASSSPAARADGGYRLDRKLVAGLRRYAENWDGPITVLLPESDGPNPFSDVYATAEMPFRLSLFRPGAPVLPAGLAPGGVALLSGDDVAQFALGRDCARAGMAVVYTIEYTLSTRLQIMNLDPARTLPRMVSGAIWLLRMERVRRAAFRQAAGLQANGLPAYDAYRQVNPVAIRYLDGRSGIRTLVTDAERAARRAHLAGGGPIRLLHSGRLEPLKGSQDVIPIARALRDAGVPFDLTIFGTGSLAVGMQRDILRHGLGDCVRLFGAVDFETELMPFARSHADAFLSCNRQSDPSCTYLESMACGLPIFGYANAMWSALRAETGAGWRVPVGDVAAMVSSIFDANGARETMVAAAEKAADFARRHTFEDVFDRRIADLRRHGGGQPAGHPIRDPGLERLA